MRNAPSALILICALVLTPAYWLNGQETIARMADTASLFGVYEIELDGLPASAGAGFTVPIRVEFTLPDQSTVRVDAFHDGPGVQRARAYCRQTGLWKWRTLAEDNKIPTRSGEFRVVPSDLRGKLRIAEQDPYQFQYDNGEWFLHLGDTGYRYVVDTEPNWQSYIDQAAAAGFTKVRTWFCRSRSTVEALLSSDRETFNLPYWQEIERRLIYALNHHPQINFQLIPYGEDTDEIKRYADGDPAAQGIMRYAQARWSAFPNVHWCFSNDRQIVEKGELSGREVRRAMIEQIGDDARQREPWRTLLTNHQARFSGYDFPAAGWSDIVTLEDIDQVHGKLILEFRQQTKAPAVLDEDRYELYRNPANARYFFRRFAWASLLSGGHPTYGGLRSYEPDDGSLAQGIHGYYDANREGVLTQGAHDYRYIHQFFEETGLTLIGFQPDDAFVGADPLRWKGMHRDGTYLLYLANPSGSEPRTDNPAPHRPSVEIWLPDGQYSVKWYDPKTGKWRDGAGIGGSKQQLSPPGSDRINWGDWIVWLQKI